MSKKQLTVIPYGERISVRLNTTPERISGLIIPDKYRATTLEGVVVKLGTGRIGNDGKRTEFEMIAGDAVLVSKYGAIQLGDEAGADSGLMTYKLHQILAILGKDFIQPCGDRVLIQVDPPEKKTRGGILLRNAAQQVKSTGKVVAQGNGGKDEKGNKREWPYTTNDRVIFESYAGTDVHIGGKGEFKMLQMNDVIGVLE